MKVLIIADPLKSLKPESDSSLAIARAFLQKKIPVFFTTESQVVLENFVLKAKAGRLESRCQTNLGRAKRRQNGGQTNLSGGGWVMGTEQKVVELSAFDLILIRKDPPFGPSYVKLCWLLSQIRRQVTIANPPEVLLRHHEKLLPIEGIQAGFLKKSDIFPTCAISSPEAGAEFVRGLSTSTLVLKPFFGFAGSDVFRVPKRQYASAVKKLFRMSSDWIVQPFSPAVLETGDARVFFIHGHFAGGFARMPKKGSIVSNLAQGGSAVLREFSKEEMKLIGRIEKWVRHLKLQLVGADLIGGKLNEMNITSPTGFLTYERLTGKNLAVDFVEGFL